MDLEGILPISYEKGCQEIASECVFCFPSTRLGVLVCMFQSINNQLSPRFLAT